MRIRCSQGALILGGAIATLLISGAVPTRAQVTQDTTIQLEVPRSVRAEHEMMHTTLLEATKAPGRVGTAARAVAVLLEAHYVREEQMVMSLLGLLKPLAAGTAIPDAVASEARKMSDTLRREMPSMLEEHKKIGAAVEGLRQAAIAEHSPVFQHLAENLASDSQQEEDLLYPAALLVGDLLRGRQAGK